MKFTTNSIKIIDGYLLLKLNKDTIEDVINIEKYCNNGEKRISCELKRERRSENANAYMWILCQKIAERLSKNGPLITKEEVYRRAIKDCMHFTPMPIKKEAVESFTRIWKGHGLGWIVEVVRDSTLKGYVTIHAYHGSSIYDSKEMSRLIDYLVDECKNLHIETRPYWEIESLIDEWKPTEE